MPLYYPNYPATSLATAKLWELPLRDKLHDKLHRVTGPELCHNLFYYLGNKHNFNKHSDSGVDSLGVPYDYSSIMHDGRKYFSINGQDTIIPKRPKVVLIKT